MIRALNPTHYRMNSLTLTVWFTSQFDIYRANCWLQDKKISSQPGSSIKYTTSETYQTFTDSLLFVLTSSWASEIERKTMSMCEWCTVCAHVFVNEWKMTVLKNENIISQKGKYKKTKGKITGSVWLQSSLGYRPAWWKIYMIQG